MQWLDRFKLFLLDRNICLNQSLNLLKWHSITGTCPWFFTAILRSNSTCTSSFSLKLQKVLVSRQIHYHFILLSNLFSQSKFALKFNESKHKSWLQISGSESEFQVLVSGSWILSLKFWILVFKSRVLGVGPFSNY